MLIVGGLSGIQEYVFDVRDSAGGQSKRLRARSFFLQALIEVAALRILDAAGWQAEQQLLSAAGKFILQGEALSAERIERITAEYDSIARWLLNHTGARIRFFVVIEEDDGTPLQQYNRAMRSLVRAKCRPLSGLAIANGEWETSNLTLESITEKRCEICGRGRARQTLNDSDGESREVCGACFLDDQLGKALPTAQWMVIHPSVKGDSFDIAGCGVTLHSAEPAPMPGAIPFSLAGDQSVSKFGAAVLTRRLARHIPTDESGRIPLDFKELAEASAGAYLLGVLKMDVDSLGKAVHGILEQSRDLLALSAFSDRLDAFFARKLDRELAKPEWDKIYTIFSGGDDLLLVGPWNTLFAYAYHARQLFHGEFADPELTVSAGMAVVQRKRPIRRAVEQADHLLKSAKELGRNRFAAFGQVWEWKEHDSIAHHCTCLSKWVNQNAAQRGWLQTLLRMAEQQEKVPLTTARLVYHVERNYPRSIDDNPDKRALRNWIDQVVGDFDSRQRAETRYLPAILRYALTATRTATGDER